MVPTIIPVEISIAAGSAAMGLVKTTTAAMQSKLPLDLGGESYEDLRNDMKQKMLTPLDVLIDADKETKYIFKNLMKQTGTIEMDGIHIGLFGLRASGKSTLINNLVGKTIADVGSRKSENQIKQYDCKRFTIWDISGSRDEIEYLKPEYMMFFKGLSDRMVIIQVKIKDSWTIIQLFEKLGLDYDIIVNKLDRLDDEEEQKVLKEHIQCEIERFALKHVKHIFWISAKYPYMFSDWLSMVDHIV